MEDIKKGVSDNSPESAEFLKVVNDIYAVAGFADNTLDLVTKSEESWLTSTFVKLFK
jgi:hypothetical protein